MAVLMVQAQMMEPVHFSSELKMLKDSEAEIVFTASIDPGWHVYSTDLGSDGPIEATFNAVKMDGVEKVGKLTPRGNVTKKFDNMFGMELKYFEKSAMFVQKIKFTKPHYVIDCYLEYGACNDEMCLPPSEVAFKEEGEAPIVAKTPLQTKTLLQQKTPTQPQPPLLSPSRGKTDSSADHSSLIGEVGRGPSSSLFVKTDYRVVKVEMSDVCYVEGMSEYLKLHLRGNQKPIITLLAMKKLEERLPPNFMRIHHSYIVNLDEIREVNKNRVILSDDTSLPIGELYKEQFNAYLSSHFLGK